VLANESATRAAIVQAVHELASQPWSGTPTQARCGEPSSPYGADSPTSQKPTASRFPGRNRATLAQLRRGLAVVVSADALFTLTDLCQLSKPDAVNSAVHTARALTQAAFHKPDCHITP
jgi:hypothetical protein